MSDPTTALATTQPTGLAVLLADPDRLKEFPIETVERLYAIHQQETAREDRATFSEAFRRVQSRMTPVHKAATGAHGSRYAKAEKIHEMLAPLLHEEGFSWSSSMADCPLKGHARIVLTLRHGPHSETHFYDAPIETGNRGMSGLHASRSTWTYCERTLLSKVFGVCETDDDDGVAGGTPGRVITDDQAHDLRALIEETGADVGKLLAIYGVGKLEELSAANFRGAVRSLEIRRAR